MKRRGVRRAAADARASGPDGIRCFDRCGAALVEAAIAAVFNAVTWVSVRSVAPVPSARRGWTATETLCRDDRQGGAAVPVAVVASG